VKLTWTREDDITFGNSGDAHHIEAGFDDNGAHRLKSPCRCESVLLRS
jgi:hypothetical protein